MQTQKDTYAASCFEQHTCTQFFVAVGQQQHEKQRRREKNKTKTGLPQLFGIVLLNLCPLLRKFHILLYQLQARLCVLFNDVILVLVEGAQHK